MAPDERLVQSGWGWTAALDARPGDLLSADGRPLTVTGRRTVGERVELRLEDVDGTPRTSSVGVGASVWGAEEHHAVCGGCGRVWPCHGHTAALRARASAHPVLGSGAATGGQARPAAVLRLVRDGP